MSVQSKQLWRSRQRVNLVPTLGGARSGVLEKVRGRGVLAVAIVAVISWGAAAVGLAVLMGWHPGFGVGP